MAKILGKLDPKKRAAEKAASRARDEHRLGSGEISREDLARANSAFGSVMSEARIKSVGGKPIRPVKGGR